MEELKKNEAKLKKVTSNQTSKERLKSRPQSKHKGDKHKNDKHAEPEHPPET